MAQPDGLWLAPTSARCAVPLFAGPEREEGPLRWLLLLCTWVPGCLRSRLCDLGRLPPVLSFWQL